MNNPLNKLTSKSLKLLFSPRKKLQLERGSRNKHCRKHVININSKIIFEMRLLQFNIKFHNASTY